MTKQSDNWQEIINKKAKKKIIYSFHATVQMNLEERLITTDEVREVLEKGKIIEERIDDARGSSFLINARTMQNRYIHVVCSPKEDFLIIVTAYIPSPKEWINKYSKRNMN